MSYNTIHCIAFRTTGVLNMTRQGFFEQLREILSNISTGALKQVGLHIPQSI